MTNSKTLHVTLQSKGGVGKSTIARVISDWLIENTDADRLRLVDCDAQTHSLHNFASLKAEKVSFIDEDDNYDVQIAEEFFEEAIEGDITLLMDIGSGGYIPFIKYAESSDLFDLFKDAGYEVYIHVPITGGADLKETLSGFDGICNHLGGAARIIVWLNPKDGSVERDGKPFNEMKVFQKHQDKIHGIVTIPRLSEMSAERDFVKMNERYMTFSDVQSGGLGLMSRKRLEKLYAALRDQLEVMFAPEEPAEAAPAKPKKAAAAEA